MSYNSASSVDQSSSDRDPRGRFAKGNPGGPGNPLGARYSKMTSMLLEAVTDEDMTRVARALVASAEKGDTAAARLLLEYCTRKPSPEQADEEEKPVHFVALLPEKCETVEEWEAEYARR